MITETWVQLYPPQRRPSPTGWVAPRNHAASLSGSFHRVDRTPWPDPDDPSVEVQEVRSGVLLRRWSCVRRELVR